VDGLDLSPTTREMFLRQLAEAHKVLAGRMEAGNKLEEAKRDADAVRERCKTFSGFVKESWHTVEPGVNTFKRFTTDR
jgi:hypothetical protein